ncbi:sigma-70 family RNA polymerase sigma factor [Candidatus Dojkabacteria bacterium]|uniref:Sigma-70 family RNA polymerase sigma factor n=1 Tax=Candidatus Dojkabacteria bacterium TaxID=2099670 RepID=A0A955L6Z2_9BACT|nr:sigma-70 family RNA polymerase sigma factor [Candidatus Dojkabacteria bacterium]
MDSQLENELIEKAKESLDAFEKLYEYYLPKIYRYILNRTANKDLAEDLTSQTFVKAMTKIKTYKDHGKSFGSWLYRIAHNNLIDHFRKNKPTAIFDINLIESEAAAEDHAMDSERKRAILHAISKIPEQYQEIISLKFFEELSNDEIADVIGTNKTNIAVKIHRSMKSLEKVLSKKEFKGIIDLE